MLYNTKKINPEKYFVLCLYTANWIYIIWIYSYGICEGNDYMELTTPALLFPAISLLMLAYTNRFVVLAQLIANYMPNTRKIRMKSQRSVVQFKKKNCDYQKYADIWGFKLFFCVTCMFLIFFKVMFLADIVFGISLLLLLISLGLLVYELQISINALNIQ